MKELCEKYKDYLTIEINTVDDFQGKEKDMILVSLVRSTGLNDPKVRRNAFVRDYRRINVAFSRAKEFLMIVGSRQTFDPVLITINNRKFNAYKSMVEDHIENVVVIKGNAMLRGSKNG